MATCWGFGVFSLAVNVILKKIPLENFAFVSAVDLESENKDEAINKYMAKTQETIKKGMTQVLEEDDN